MPLRRVLLLSVLALAVSAPVADARRDVPDGFFGTFWGGLARQADQSKQDAQWALMARSGVESVRTVFSWGAAQPIGPSIAEFTDFSETDRIVRRGAQRGIKILPVVLDTPGWARQMPVDGSPPADVKDYTEYLRQLIDRYGPSGSFWAEHPKLPRRPLREWQIWNEPHLRYFWSADGWPAGYARLLKASYRTIKQADPGARVVMAAVADFAWRHVRKLYAQGVRGRFDVAAINFYTSTPENVARGVRKFRNALNFGGGRHTPIYLTEVTFPASKGRNEGQRRAYWQKAWETTDRGMSRRVRETYGLLADQRKNLRLERAYWYTWSSSYSPGDFFEYGGLLSFDGSRFRARPALRAYRASARLHQGCAKTSAGVCR